MFSCEFDDLAPTATNFSLNDSNGVVLLGPEDTLTFRAIFRDDVSLETYSVQIRSDLQGSQSVLSIVPYAVDTNFAIGGREVEAFRQFILPASIESGTYNFDVEFSDEEGQNGSPFTLLFEIENERPLIERLSPLDDSVNIAVGETLSIQAEINARTLGLSLVNLSLSRSVDLDSSVVLLQRSFSSLDGSLSGDQLFLDEIYNPVIADTGLYTLFIEAGSDSLSKTSLSSKVLIRE